MCSGSETVLSDVHLNTRSASFGTCHVVPNFHLHFKSHADLKAVQTRFEFNVAKEILTNEGTFETFDLTLLPGSFERNAKEGCALYDSDGDLIYSSTEQNTKDIIIIDHFLATPLALVGLQVWRGSLLLADYFLHTGKTLLADTKLIELGAGTGFCSIVAAMFAETVIVTDFDEGVLEMCERNMQQNQHLMKAEVSIKMLDWLKDMDNQTAKDVKWIWSPEERKMLRQLNMAIASDERT